MVQRTPCFFYIVSTIILSTLIFRWLLLRGIFFLWFIRWVIFLWFIRWVIFLGFICRIIFLWFRLCTLLFYATTKSLATNKFNAVLLVVGLFIGSSFCFSPLGVWFFCSFFVVPLFFFEGLFFFSLLVGLFLSFRFDFLASLSISFDFLSFPLCFDLILFAGLPFPLSLFFIFCLFFFSPH